MMPAAKFGGQRARVGIIIDCPQNDLFQGYYLLRDENHRKIPLVFGKMLATNVFLSIATTFVMIHFGNVDVDHVQTSSNIYVGIANDHLWSIITPYLGREILRAQVREFPTCDRRGREKRVGIVKDGKRTCSTKWAEMNIERWFYKSSIHIFLWNFFVFYCWRFKMVQDAH